MVGDGDRCGAEEGQGRSGSKLGSIANNEHMGWAHIDSRSNTIE